ncbi:hypothetical protein KY290_034999 [Solanum tuberosum]|nr:hypothetical protein KY285_028733 [Solanum tuberosum]KAH0741956.1 hypothetical protein KY290_034999 [Solanum tuberosum]
MAAAMESGTEDLLTAEPTLASRGGPLWLRAGAAIAYGYSNGRAPAERKVRITSAPPAKRAAGAAGKCLVSQQPSEPGGALEERGAH